MSFISVVGRENFINVVSDGLVINIETGEETGHNYKKFSKISNNQFVAYGGNQGIAEAIKETLPLSDIPYDLKVVSKLIHKRLLDEIPYGQARSTVAIGGLNLEGKIEFHSFSNNPDEKFYSFYPVNDDISYTFLNTQHIHHVNLDQQFEQCVRQTGINTSNKIIKAQKKMNDFVASIDPTVNRLTFELTIRKS